tara:strand:+ start:592 stop:771 length:180 start_codon:yes stop_codon:yes gene_type:complete
MNRPKLIAKITGFISIVICLIYLLFISVFDFRNNLNNYLINQTENMGAIVSYLRNHPLN